MPRRALIGSRPEHGQGEHTPEFRVLVTPAKGVFTRGEGIVEGQAVTRGTQLGTVRTNRDEHAIVATKTGVLTEWLRNDGDIVGGGPAGGPPARRIGHLSPWSSSTRPVPRRRGYQPRASSGSATSGRPTSSPTPT